MNFLKNVIRLKVLELFDTVVHQVLQGKLVGNLQEKLE